MGGTILKEGIVIENDEYVVKGNVDAWETCLWILKVFGTITKKSNNETIQFEYNTLDRCVFNTAYNNQPCFDRFKSSILSTIGDLIIIRAIKPDYYKDDPLSDGDLNIKELFGD